MNKKVVRVIAFVGLLALVGGALLPMFAGI
jgi:hypothetical protein